MEGSILSNVILNKRGSTPSPGRGLSGKTASGRMKTGKDRESMLNVVMRPFEDVEDEAGAAVQATNRAANRRMTASPGQIASFLAGLDGSGSSHGSERSEQDENVVLSLDLSGPSSESSSAALSRTTHGPSAVPASPAGLPSAPHLTSGGPLAHAAPALPALDEDALDEYADVWGNYGAGRDSLMPRPGRASIIPDDLADLLAEDSGEEEEGGRGRTAGARPPAAAARHSTVGTGSGAGSLAASAVPSSDALNTSTSTAVKAGNHRTKTPGKSLIKTGTTTGRKRSVVFGSPQAAFVDQSESVECGITGMGREEAAAAYGMHKHAPELGRLSFDDAEGQGGGSAQDVGTAGLLVLPPASSGGATAPHPLLPSDHGSSILGTGVDADGDAIMAMTPAQPSGARRARRVSLAQQAQEAPGAQPSFASPPAVALPPPAPASSGRPPRGPPTPRSALAPARAEEASVGPASRRSPRLSGVPLPSPLTRDSLSLDDSGIALPPGTLMASVVGGGGAHSGAGEMGVDPALARVAAVRVAPVAKSVSPGPVVATRGPKPANRRATFAVIPGRGLTVMAGPGGAAPPRRAPSPALPTPAVLEDSGEDMDTGADRTIGSVGMRRLDALLGDDSLSASMLHAPPASFTSAAGSARRRGGKPAEPAPGDITVSLGLARGALPAFPTAGGAGAAPRALGAVFGVSSLLGPGGRLTRSSFRVLDASMEEEGGSDVTVHAPATLGGLLASERKAEGANRGRGGGGGALAEHTTALPGSLSALMADEEVLGGGSRRGGLRTDAGLAGMFVGDLSIGAGFGMGGGMAEDNSMAEEGASVLGQVGDTSGLDHSLDVTGHLEAEGNTPKTRPVTPVGRVPGLDASDRTAADMDLSGASDASDGSVDTVGVVEEEARLLERALPGLTPNRAAMLAVTRAHAASASKTSKAASASKATESTSSKRSRAELEGSAVAHALVAAAPAPAATRDAETNTSAIVSVPPTPPACAAPVPASSSKASSTRSGASSKRSKGGSSRSFASVGTSPSSVGTSPSSACATERVGSDVWGQGTGGSVDGATDAVQPPPAALVTAVVVETAAAAVVVQEEAEAEAPTPASKRSRRSTASSSSSTSARRQSGAVAAAPAPASLHKAVTLPSAAKAATPMLAAVQSPVPSTMQEVAAVVEPPVILDMEMADAQQVSAGAAAAALAEASANAAALAAAQAARAAYQGLLESTGWSVTVVVPSGAFTALSLSFPHPDGSSHVLALTLPNGLGAGGAPVWGSCTRSAGAASVAEASGFTQGGISAFHAAASAPVSAALQAGLASGAPLRSAVCAATEAWRAVDALCTQVAALRTTYSVRFSEADGGSGASWCLVLDVSRAKSVAGGPLKARVELSLDLASHATRQGASPAMPTRVLWLSGPTACGTALAAALSAAQTEYLSDLPSSAPFVTARGGLLAALARTASEEMKRQAAAPAV